MFIRSRQLARAAAILVGKHNAVDVARILGISSDELLLAARGETAPADIDRVWARFTDPVTARHLASLEIAAR